MTDFVPGLTALPFGDAFDHQGQHTDFHVGLDVEYYHKDHLGSSTAMTGMAGLKTSGMAYLPYGMQRGTEEITSTGYTFTDQELDTSTGLYNYDARLYDPVVGQFVSADSVVPDWYGPQSLNRYSYALNNPINYTDPDGHIAGVDDALVVYASYTLATAITAGIAHYAAPIAADIGKWGGQRINKKAEKDTTDTIPNCPVPGVKPVRKTKGNTQIGEKEDGDFDSANDDFDDLNLVDVKDYPGDRRVGKLPDGRTVIVRPSKEGRPTIEIQKNGKTKIEIRYGKKKQVVDGESSSGTNEVDQGSRKRNENDDEQ